VQRQCFCSIEATLLSRTTQKQVLVLDEPTNGLDTETLELLEERLLEFSGTILLVSHDRVFLNYVVTSTLVFEAGGVREYVGGYDGWIGQRSEPVEKSDYGIRTRKEEKLQPPLNENRVSRRRLAYREKRELDMLPAKIETLEATIAELHETMAQPDFYKQTSSEIAGKQLLLKELSQQPASAYTRWEELEQSA
jgi:ABC transport system ATP-binding/permease protein